MEKLVAGGSLRTNSGDERNGAALGMFQDGTPNTYKQNQLGRFPANVILDEEAGAMLDEQSGITKASETKKSDNRTENNNQVLGKGLGLHNPSNSYNDKGGASRFFYCAKPSKRERNLGCENFEPKHKSSIQTQNFENAKTGSGNERNILHKNNHPTVKLHQTELFLTHSWVVEQQELVLCLRGLILSELKWKRNILKLPKQELRLGKNNHKKQQTNLSKQPRFLNLKI